MADLPDYYRINFEDEAPAFGCGARCVLVAACGPKWVKLLNVADASVETLERADFERLLKKSQRVTFVAKDLTARLLRNARDHKSWSATLRGVLVDLGADVKELPAELQPQAQPAALAVKAAAGVAVVAAEGGGAPPPPSDAPAPLDKEGSGKFIQRMWLTGRYSPEEIVALVLASYPGRTTKKSDVYYNYKKLLDARVEGVPPWPSKS